MVSHGLLQDQLSPAAAGEGLVVYALLDAARALLVELAVSHVLALPLKLVASAPLGVVALSGTARGKLGVGPSAPQLLPLLGAPGTDLRPALGRSTLTLVWRTLENRVRTGGERSVYSEVRVGDLRLPAREHPATPARDVLTSDILTT